jgi:hypothetical protein
MTQPMVLPESFPDWARTLVEAYFSGTTCVFILHGNVHDLVRCADGDDLRYCGIVEFLAGQVFGSWDLIVQYDLAGGLRPKAGSDAKRLQGMMQHLTGRLGDPGAWPRDPDAALLLLERLLERNLLETDASKQKRIGVVLDYAQYLAPASDLAGLTKSAGTNLVRLLGWAQNPYFKRVNSAICLVAEKLAEVNDRLVRNPYVATVHPMDRVVQ